MLGTNFYIDAINVLEAVLQHPHGISILGIEKTLDKWGNHVNYEDIEEIISLAEEAHLITIHTTAKYVFYSPKEE